MISRTELDHSNFLTWRETPWDKKVFKLKTYELVDMHFDRDENALDLLNVFESQINPDLAYIRINSNEFQKKGVLVKSGFLQCETAFKIHLPSLQAYDLPLPIKVLQIHEIQKQDFRLVYENIGGMFKYSRFHEDPLIPRSLADERMHSWIKDLEEKRISGLLYKTEANVLVAYMFFRAVDYEVDLILGGAVPGKNMYAAVFWASLIDYFKRRGFKKISTTISAINDGMLSLYLGLGFKISRSLIDFHKHYHHIRKA